MHFRIQNIDAVGLPDSSNYPSRLKVSANVAYRYLGCDVGVLPKLEQFFVCKGLQRAEGWVQVIESFKLFLYHPRKRFETQRSAPLILASPRD